MPTELGRLFSPDLQSLTLTLPGDVNLPAVQTLLLEIQPFALLETLSLQGPFLRTRDFMSCIVDLFASLPRCADVRLRGPTAYLAHLFNAAANDVTDPATNTTNDTVTDSTRVLTSFAYNLENFNSHIANVAEQDFLVSDQSPPWPVPGFQQRLIPSLCDLFILSQDTQVVLGVLKMHVLPNLDSLRLHLLINERQPLRPVLEVIASTFNQLTRLRLELDDFMPRPLNLSSCLRHLSGLPLRR